MDSGQQSAGSNGSDRKAEAGTTAGKDRANNWFYVRQGAGIFLEKPRAWLDWGLVCVNTGPAKWAVRAQGQAVRGTRAGSELPHSMGKALGEEGLAWW